MDKIYKRYAESRGNKNTSAFVRYMQTEKQSVSDNYIQQKNEIRANYLYGQAEKEMIDNIANEIVKSVDEILDKR